MTGTNTHMWELGIWQAWHYNSVQKDQTTQKTDAGTIVRHMGKQNVCLRLFIRIYSKWMKFKWKDKNFKTFRTI